MASSLMAARNLRGLTHLLSRLPKQGSFEPCRAPLLAVNAAGFFTAPPAFAREDTLEFTRARPPVPPVNYGIRCRTFFLGSRALSGTLLPSDSRSVLEDDEHL